VSIEKVEIVMFCSLAVLDPRVGHTMEVLSPFICAKLLGVHLRHDLNFSQHVESVVAICNQRIYLLAQLKKQSLVSTMDYIFNAIVLNEILYAL